MGVIGVSSPMLLLARFEALAERAILYIICCFEVHVRPPIDLSDLLNGLVTSQMSCHWMIVQQLHSGQLMELSRTTTGGFQWNKIPPCIRIGFCILTFS